MYGQVTTAGKQPVQTVQTDFDLHARTAQSGVGRQNGERFPLASGVPFVDQIGSDQAAAKSLFIAASFRFAKKQFIFDGVT
jgi:hypothetical protein